MESRLAFYDTESPVETGTSPEHYYFKSNSEYLSKYYPEKISLYVYSNQTFVTHS